MTYRAFHFIEGVTRTHLAGWTGTRWRIPCGLISMTHPKPATLTLPMCRTCDQLTAQLDPDPVRHP